MLLTSEVRSYLKGDLSFLPVKSKAAEDEWGKELMGTESCMWQKEFCEKIVAEALGAKPCAPKDGYRMDFETDEHVIEVKGGTYLTIGSAHEKIAGLIFKYAEVPRVFGKPLLVVCVAGAEQYARKAGLFGSESGERQQLLAVAKTLGITFAPMSQFLKRKIECPILEEEEDVEAEEESHCSECHFYTRGTRCTCIRVYLDS